MNGLNRILLLALALVLALLWLVRVDHTQPNDQIIFGNDMTYSPAYGAYAPNVSFANGRTLQDPVAGTLARGEQRFQFQATPEDALRAGEQLNNPNSTTDADKNAAADRGAVVFQTFCVSCHGGDGNGNGPVARRGFPPPPSLLTGKSREMKDGQLFHILTCGQNNIMPSFAIQLPANRRWDVVSYIRRLQQAAPPPTPAASAAPAPAPQAAGAETPPTSQPIRNESAPAESKGDSQP